jgi:sugar O-acyltransferase (sialic acid O-acetyltransferase NeuD family)
LPGTKLVIIGTGGLGRETLWGVRAWNDSVADPSFEIVGMLTSTLEEHGREIEGATVLGAEDWVVGKPGIRAVCAIGDPRGRRRVALALAEQGVEFATVFHPAALLPTGSALGQGCIIGAGAVLTTGVDVGDHVVVGVNAVVSHDVLLEDFATLAPGVVLGGHCHVGYGAEIGLNACVRPRLSVGRGSQVGAQAAVVDDIEENVVVAGVPARLLRRAETEL